MKILLEDIFSIHRKEQALLKKLRKLLEIFQKELFVKDVTQTGKMNNVDLQKIILLKNTFQIF